MPKYTKLISSITIAILFLLTACSQNGEIEIFDLPGISITYPTTLLQGSCGMVTLAIGEDLPFFSEFTHNSLSNSANLLPGEETHFVLQTNLVLPGVSVDPAGTVMQPWVDGSAKAFSWEICPSSSGVFEGTLWVYGSVSLGDALSSKQEPIGAYKIKMQVNPVPMVFQNRLMKYLGIVISMALIIVSFLSFRNYIKKVIGKK